MTQKQVYSNYHPPTYEACNIILLNMKNHYRRLYSVKPAVDTSPPESYKLLTRKTSRSLSCLDLSLSNLSSFKLCQRPDIKHEVQNHEMQRTMKSINKRRSCISVDKGANQHCRERNRAKPSIPSCHRNPRTVLINMENSKVYTSKEKVLDSGKACSESSQDSAYNEGEIGSSERGSRTPTPETVVNTSSKLASNPALGSSTYCRRTRNYLYLKFLAEITDEILKKGVVTNKALKRIFNHHLEANIYHLNQHRMQLELETLRNKLGIPEDDAQNAADFGVGSGEGPTCQPLFHDLPGFDDQMNTKSVLQKGLLTSKMAWTPEVLEAFTVLGDNQKLINSIQSSVKSVVKNLRQVSLSVSESKISNKRSSNNQDNSEKVSGLSSLRTDSNVDPQSTSLQRSSCALQILDSHRTSHSNTSSDSSQNSRTLDNNISIKSTKENVDLCFTRSGVSMPSQNTSLQETCLNSVPLSSVIDSDSVTVEKSDGSSLQNSNKMLENVDSIKSSPKSCDLLMPLNESEGTQVSEFVESQKTEAASQKSSNSLEWNSPHVRIDSVTELDNSQEAVNS